MAFPSPALRRVELWPRQPQHAGRAVFLEGPSGVRDASPATRLLGKCSFSREWLIALSDMAKVNPTEDRDIKARIYRDFDSLRGYQVSNVKKLGNQVIS